MPKRYLKFSKEMQQEYIKHGGMICPYCGSLALKVSPGDINGRMMAIKNTCLSCEKNWHELYKFLFVVHEEETTNG